MKLTTSRGATVATIFTVILVIASLCSIIIMQTSNASASNVVYKQKIRGDVAVAQKTITQGSNPSGTIFIDLSAKGFTTTAGDKQVCVTVQKSDPDESDTVFEGCGPAKQLTIANTLGSATFSGTVTGFDFATGKEETVTVNAKLIATGKPETSKFRTHTNNQDVVEVFHSYGKIRPASGSLNIAGDITFSFDDARGIISKFASDKLQVTKN